MSAYAFPIGQSTMPPTMSSSRSFMPSCYPISFSPIGYMDLSMPRTPLAPEDAARLHMDLPENPMIIVAALELEGALDHTELLALLRERLLGHARFRQRVVESTFGFGVPRWEEDPRFELVRHVHRHLDDGRPLLVRVAEVANRTLVRDRPLWEMHVMERALGDVLVARIHHVVADGAGLVRLLRDLAGEPPPQDRSVQSEKRKQRGLRVRRLVGGVAAATRLLRSGSDPRSRLTGELGKEKRLCASATLSLQTLHEAARARGVTITELLLSSIAGALRERVGGRVVHALVPVALQTRETDAGNRYISVFVPLRVALEDVGARVRDVAHELRELRAHHQSISSGVSLTSAAGAATAVIERAGVRLFSKRATLMVSVVRGPEHPLRFAGATVRDVTVWAPVPGTIALGITLMSYAGRVRVGLNADARVVQDPELILSDVLRELSQSSA